MKIIKDIEGCELTGAVITTGNFDGVHRGHRFLLDQLVAKAQALSLPAVVVMFYPHPKQVLHPNAEPYLYLSDEQQQMHLIEDCGVDYVVQLSFDKAMASWSAEDFVTRMLLSKLGMKYYLVGYDHRLGNPRYSDDISQLSEKYSFGLQRSEPFYSQGVLLSSTVVRQALSEGRVADAALFLGRDYGFACTVVGGKRIGRTIGYPTANLVPCFDFPFLPKDGVYACRINVAGIWYGGMMQLGNRPTLDDGRGLTLEVHIFDFKDEIYGLNVELVFHDYLRGVEKFNHIDDLVKQLKNDETNARASLGKQ